MYVNHKNAPRQWARKTADDIKAYEIEYNLAIAIHYVYAIVYVAKILKILDSFQSIRIQKVSYIFILEAGTIQITCLLCRFFLSVLMCLQQSCMYVYTEHTSSSR